MEATYCMGSDVDVCRMFDQYLYKRSENLDLSLSVAPPSYHSNSYMADQTFHTPSFGDEEFDIPPINPHQHTSSTNSLSNMTYQQNQMLQNQSSENLVMSSPSAGYQQQQPMYIAAPEHSMGISVSSSYSNPQPTYTMANPSDSTSHLLMMQQQHQQSHHSQMLMAAPHGHTGMGNYSHSSQGGSPPVGLENTTTSDDSDDNTPHSAMMAGMKRPSPEPADIAMTKMQPKKPKVQKKKKKRDPNEPQKPVSAYALFFRDTQAAIKGQNPNASFGEVSKIVASMWDGLDADHKNVYKKKTEAAKKEYLKALAAYRASLVSKGAGETDSLYTGYGGYGGAYGGYSPPSSMSPPTQQSQQQQQQQQQQQLANMVKKSPLMNTMMTDRNNQQQTQGMVGPVTGHISQQHMQDMSQQHMQEMPQQHIQNTGYMSHVNPQGEQLVSSPPPVSGGVGPPPPTSGSMQQPSLGALGGAQPRLTNTCIRHGCSNAAIANPEWEDEYCSNECVVSHCRDVFNSWVASNQAPPQNFSTVK